MTNNINYIAIIGRLIEDASFYKDDKGNIEYAVITISANKYHNNFLHISNKALETKQFNVFINHRNMLKRHGHLLRNGCKVIIHGELDANKGIDCKLLIVVGDKGEVNILLDPYELENDKGSFIDSRQEAFKFQLSQLSCN